MASVNNLLKFRFEKKDQNKLPKASGSGGNSADKPLVNGLQCIPETSESDLASAASSPSPVFKKSMKKYKRPRISESESDDDTQTQESAASSPWLSKEQGIATMNGSSANTKHDSTTKTSSMDDREMMVGIRRLKSMFPNMREKLFTDALNATGDVEKAIDWIMEGKYLSRHKTGSKPSSSGMMKAESQESSSSEILEPPRKRARPLLSDDSQETSTQENSQTKGQGQTQDDPKTDDEKETEDEAVNSHMEFLSGAFPEIPKEVLLVVLDDHKCDVEAAVAELSVADKDLLMAKAGMGPQTSNVGSIKAFKQMREQAKKRKSMEYTELSEDDDTPAPVIKEKTKPVEEVIELSDSEKGDDGQESSDEDESCNASQENLIILKFLNESTKEELEAVPGCSTKKAGQLEAIRPFDDWEDMAEKLMEAKLMSIITGVSELLSLRKSISKLMLECERISEVMENVVGQLMSSTTLSESSNSSSSAKKKTDVQITRQPSNLNSSMSLKPYQMVGLNWLVLMHKQKLNSILADEMGLGKTIQTVAMLAYLLEHGNRGPHLVVTPTSTIDNWLKELRKWCPDLKVLLYYGAQEERRDIRCQIMDGYMDEFHVVVTSYNIATNSKDDRAMFRKLKFHYAVYDEGHMLKNMASQRYQSLMKIKSQRRLLLTGTPLQNNLLELMSLLNFIMPDLFEGKQDYLKDMFTKVSGRAEGKRSGYEEETIAHAKSIMKPFVLRRLKSEVIKQMPKKTEKVEFVPLAFPQQELYDGLKQQFTSNLEEADKAGTASSKMSSMLMQLRKAANHHLLHRCKYDEPTLRKMAKKMLREPTHRDAVEQYIFEDMEVMSDFELHQLCGKYKNIREFRLEEDDITDSGKFRFLDEILPELKEKGDRVLLFSQFTTMLDIVEKYLEARGHTYVRLDGSTPVAERQERIDLYNVDPNIFIFLLSTRAGGLGINLTAANVVVLHDIDFNPYNDKQAEDRCHRMGQTKTVTIHRLIGKNTIEEAMYRCGESKLRLEKDVTGVGKGDEEVQADVASMLREALSMKKS